MTTDLAALNTAGRFARDSLPIFLTTSAGQHRSQEMATTLITSVVPNQPSAAEELLPSLHVLLHDATVRAAQLPQTVQKLQQVVSHGHPLTALAFLARYITDPAIDGNWLTWYTRHWQSLNDETRSLACVAAQRPDLPDGLRDCLVQHLLTTDTREPWQHAAALWPKMTAEQRSSLLATAGGRAPELAQSADQADTDLLCAALVKAEEQLSDALALISPSRHGDHAIAEFVSFRLSQSEWKPTLCDTAVAAATDVSPLWDVVAASMDEDQTAVRRAADVLNSLATHHAESIPESIVQTLTLPLREADEPLATAIGHALRGHHKIAKRLRDAMKGHSSATGQRRRNTAFCRPAAWHRHACVHPNQDALNAVSVQV